MIVDCMLPAGIAAGQSARIPTASLVHFPYGLAREQMLRGGGAWTTDRARLNATRRGLGLQPADDDLAAWESVELLLVTVPKWFDVALDFPANVVHAGPWESLGRLTCQVRPSGDRSFFSASAPR
jgi:hypothetical protein